MRGVPHEIPLPFGNRCFLLQRTTRVTGGNQEEKGSWWSSNPSGKCSCERPTRGTVCGTMRSMCGADAGCLAINQPSLVVLKEERDFSQLMTSDRELEACS